MRQKLKGIEEQLTDDNKERFCLLEKREKTIIAALEVVKSEYIAFAFGFLSAVVVDELMGIFRKRVAEDLWGFILSAADIVLLGIGCFCFLRFSTAFTELQSTFASKRTPTAGYNAVFSDFEGTRKSIDGMLRQLRTILLVSAAALLLNLAYFVLINVL